MKQKQAKQRKSIKAKPTSANKRRLLIVFVSFAVIGGVLMALRSFAATGPGQCVAATDQQAKSADPSAPVCQVIGTTGALTYWMDKTFPNKRVHVLRIDLSNKQLVVRASHVSERGKTPTEYAKFSGSVAAINGDFFNQNNNFNPNGLAIGNGEQWPFTIDKKTSSFVACTLQRECIMDDYYTEQRLDPKKYTSAVGGSEILLTPTFQWHLKPGEPGCGAIEHTCSSPHPRTGVALSADRKIMWWVVVEGRQTDVTGLSLYDFTQVFKRLGATRAINLDGGGSSGMVLNGKLVNKRPSDDPMERKVGNALGIIELPVRK